ncbi:hypothetical protein GLOIN_2v1144455 [Rhizophagus irregularis DAOM 181602=DAOM 197198]|uniref:Uncharacterized protein n=1 Tax=Rhizophagus irregularis (strain DAOM 181602 / DAOM 197198 / MUCL 43194) TaxID=747089 RepID=A0A2P4Q552_RHIID|nr:hypothetical protein GLOIN_2v1144455 [Rhizophagus irregularis DAOM 181602=DAOM 197198]POG72779.1 hypothetical protein GLOIN_2v1144455 [Rhizophagus irregularis DAOM 181602=DAOM 197198]|eukprot:XP_025179645.1 hypothetical protein GLOIN_2v1144455 [Rhizophagus irregularis DAOM 181602=DAOM 197198]
MRLIKFILLCLIMLYTFNIGYQFALLHNEPIENKLITLFIKHKCSANVNYGLLGHLKLHKIDYKPYIIEWSHPLFGHLEIDKDYLFIVEYLFDLTDFCKSDREKFLYIDLVKVIQP